MTPPLEGWKIKAKEARSPHEVKLTPLDTNPVFKCLGAKFGFSKDSKYENLITFLLSNNNKVSTPIPFNFSGKVQPTQQKRMGVGMDVES